MKITSLKTKNTAEKTFIENMHKLEPTTVVMEACYSANYFAREFTKLGHDVKLIPAQHVKPFVRGNKNDANDAMAIGEASMRPNLTFVEHKTIEQQDIQCLHRIRERLVSQRTSITNQSRGLLSEYGFIEKAGEKGFKALMHNVLNSKELTAFLLEEIASVYEEWLDVSERLKRVNNKITNLANSNAVCTRLLSIPGIGVINATAIYCTIGNAKHFKTSRDFAVWLGLTPKQSASGLQSHMGSITKRGNSYLRKQIVHGARSHLYRTQNKTDDLSIWAQKILERRGSQKACVALAHKLARIVWAVLTKEEVYKEKLSGSFA